MQIVVPMSGLGQRFIDAGYSTIKPLIEIESKPIIQHVIERFCPDDDYIFICNKEHLKNTSLEEVLYSLRPKAKIISIEKHKLGPVYAVSQAFNFLDMDMPTIVNYCDFSWRWDYINFKDTVLKNKCDGCIISYKGFHPHLIGDNLYASMRHKNNWMEEIQEKYSFTKNKMDCYQSSGTYYFKDGRLIKKYFQQFLNKGNDINGEFYVSMIYKEMKQDDLNIYIYPISYFLQWGTPDDLKEYLYWSHYFFNNPK